MTELNRLKLVEKKAKKLLKVIERAVNERHEVDGEPDWYGGVGTTLFAEWEVDTIPSPTPVPEGQDPEIEAAVVRWAELEKAYRALEKVIDS